MEESVTSYVAAGDAPADGTLFHGTSLPSELSEFEESNMESAGCDHPQNNTETQSCCDDSQSAAVEDESPITETDTRDRIRLHDLSEAIPEWQERDGFEERSLGKTMEDFECGKGLDLEEPKMCNEKTATYWTGGGPDSQNEEQRPAAKLLKDGQVEVDWTMPYYLTENHTPHSNVRLYFPLQKTLRNLRLLDLRLKYNTQQVALENKPSECTNDSSSDESDAKLPEQTEQDNAAQETTEDIHNSSLFAVLSQCQNKLEEMEELEHYSRQLERSLWEAQNTVASLKEAVAALHRENAQKEDDIFLLSEELLESKRLLYEKSERLTDMNVMFRNLGRHLENSRKQQQLESTCQRNNHSTPASENPAPRATRDSKICTIL